MIEDSNRRDAGQRRRYQMYQDKLGLSNEPEVPAEEIPDYDSLTPDENKEYKDLFKEASKLGKNRRKRFYNLQNKAGLISPDSSSEDEGVDEEMPEEEVA